MKSVFSWGFGQLPDRHGLELLEVKTVHSGTNVIVHEALQD